MGLGVPEADGLVAGARGQQFAVVAEGYQPDVAGVPAQDGDRGACGDVPEADGPVFPGAGEKVAVGTKRQTQVKGVLAVALESGDLKRAFEAYAKCIEIEPEYAPAHEYLGEAYLMSGDVAKAKAQLLWLVARKAADEVATLTQSIEAYEKSKGAGSAADSTAKGGGW